MMDTRDSPPIVKHRIHGFTMERCFWALLGVAVIALPAWELFRGVWPPNVFSLVFLIIILGAGTVGVPLLAGSLTAPSVLWTARPGQIRIIQKRPFRRAQHDTLRRDDIASLETHENEQMDGESTWGVTLVTRDGRRFDTRSFATREGADRFRERLDDMLGA